MKYTEEDIINGCIKKQGKFQEALYNLYSSRMMSICLRYTNSKEDAEDVFHEAFVKAFNKIYQYSGGNFYSWLRKVFVTTAINYYHFHKKYKDNIELQELISDEHEDHYSNAIEKLSADELIAILNELPHGYKTVLNLYAIEGFSHKEIAEMLNISEGTSKSQLFKGKAMLKTIIEDKYKIPNVKEA